MSDEQQIVGECHEVSERNGWTTFVVSIAGKQYPVKLSTKKETLVAAARAVGTQVATWTFKEVESDKINEHTGKPYVNRYLENVEAGASAAPTAAVTQARSSSDAAHQPMLSGDKDRAITRLAVLKAAAQVYAGTKDVDGVIAAASRLEVWVMRDIDVIPFDGASAATTGPLVADEPPPQDEWPRDQNAALSASQQARAEPSGADDGIPF